MLGSLVSLGVSAPVGVPILSGVLIVSWGPHHHWMSSSLCPLHTLFSVPECVPVPPCRSVPISPQVSIVDSGVRGAIAVGLVPQHYSLEHPPGWLPGSVAYHADDGK